MPLQKEFAAARVAWQPLTLYQKFEHACILILTALIAIVIVFATWNLALKILLSIFTSRFDPTDYAVFQAVFGMIFYRDHRARVSSARCWCWPSAATASCRLARWC